MMNVHVSPQLGYPLLMGSALMVGLLMTPLAQAAPEAVQAGEPVPNPVTRAYGCTIKYAD